MAKKARRQDGGTVGDDTVAIDADSNLDPQQRFEKHFGLVLAAKDDLEAADEARRSANSAYRETPKTAKKAGLDTEAMVCVLQLRKQEPADVTRRFTNLNRYLAWARIPVGTQLGLFEPGLTVASKVDGLKSVAPEGGEDPNAAPAPSAPADERIIEKIEA